MTQTPLTPVPAVAAGVRAGAGLPARELAQEAQQPSVRNAVAENVRLARQSLGLSLRELSDRTGVSKALLSQIERSVANPTLEVLARVATELGLTVTELTRISLAQPQVIRHPDGPMVPEGETVIRMLFSSMERTRFEMSEGVVAAESTSAKQSHGVGSVEIAYVISGDLRVSTTEWERELRPGDAIRFSSAVDHWYRAGQAPARVLTLVSFTQ